MLRPRVFRDPIHGQIRFVKVDLHLEEPPATQEIDWLIPQLIGTKVFQRLHHVRQNGLSNYVFYGMEHSRFTHSIGTYHMAMRMYDTIVRNMDQEKVDEPGRRSAVAASALLHDIGHGAFSHLLEEVLRSLGIPFHHEFMTVRLVKEDTGIKSLLESVDPGLPDSVAAYINKTLREKDHWSYRVVSSQLDADRIDYMHRDAQMAGIIGHGFDLPRLLDFLYIANDRVIVHRGATEALEAYLLMLYHLYVAVYYHRAIRSANVMLGSILRRATKLSLNGDDAIPKGSPLYCLITKGQEIELQEYSRIVDYSIWSLVDNWQYHKDPILSDIARRLMSRQTFRATPVDSGEDLEKYERVNETLPTKIAERIPNISKEEAKEFYCIYDAPERVPYKIYPWYAKEGFQDESIWLGTLETDPIPIESESRNQIFDALKKTKRVIARFVYPVEVQNVMAELVG